MPKVKKRKEVLGVSILTQLVMLYHSIFRLVRIATGRGNMEGTLNWFAFALVIAGIIFGESRLIGYGLMSGGVTLAIIDIIIKMRTPKI